MNEVAVLIIVIPFVGAGAALISRIVRRDVVARISAIVSLAACSVVLGMVVTGIENGGDSTYSLGTWSEPMGIALIVNRLAVLSAAITLVVAIFALIYTLADRSFGSYFYFFFLMLIGGMLGIIFTGDLFNMFVFIEIVSIASFVLIAYRGKPLSLAASYRYLILSTVGVAFFLIGIFLVYRQTGVLSLREIADQAEREDWSFQRHLALTFLVAGVGIKASFVPFHTWLPDAHASAPHSVSAVLSGVMIKISFLAVLRIVRILGEPRAYEVFLWIGIATALFGVFRALAQSDIKRLLAYHSISQMGLIVASFGVGSGLALAASLYHVLNHAMFKALLFLVAGCVIASTGERDLGRLGGLAKRMPLAAVAYGVGALSICGIPPFNGFASKAYISAGMFALPGVRVLITAASVGTVASFIKLGGMFFGKPAHEKVTAEAEVSVAKIARIQIGVPASISLVGLSIVCLATGLFPRTIGSFLGAAVAMTTVVPKVYSWAKLAATALTVAMGIVLYVLVRSKRGKSVQHTIRGINLRLEDALTLAIAGVLAMAAVLVLPDFL